MLIFSGRPFFTVRRFPFDWLKQVFSWLSPTAGSYSDPADIQVLQYLLKKSHSADIMKKKNLRKVLLITIILKLSDFSHSQKFIFMFKAIIG